MAELVVIKDLERMAQAIAGSGLFGIKTPNQALALMLIAQAEGRHPATAARDYDIIQGRPSKKAEAMLRDFNELGGRVEWHELTDTKASATFTHPLNGKVTIDWDMDRAKKAELASKDVWKKYPRQMLRSRVVSEGVRTVCPLATSGMYVPEEIRDMEPPKPVRDVYTAVGAELPFLPPKPLETPPEAPIWEKEPDPVLDYVIQIGTRIKGKRLCEVPLADLAEAVRIIKTEGYTDPRAIEFVAKVEQLQGMSKE